MVYEPPLQPYNAAGHYVNTRTATQTHTPTQTWTQHDTLSGPKRFIS